MPDALAFRRFTATRRRLVALAAAHAPASAILPAAAEQLLEAGLDRVQLYCFACGLAVAAERSGAVRAAHFQPAEVPALVRRAGAAGVPMRDGSTSAFPLHGGAMLVGRAEWDESWQGPVAEVADLVGLALQNAARAPEVGTLVDFDEAGIGVSWVGRNGELLDVNPKLCAMLGYTRAELLALSYQEMTVTPEDMARDRAVHERMLAGTEREVVLDKQLRRKDRRVIWLRVTITRAKANARGAAFLTFSEDITDQKEAEAKLRESQLRLALLVDHAPAAIALLDREMRYVAISRRYAEDYGLASRDVVGLRHDDVFPETGPRWRAIHARCLEGATERSAGEAVVRADGHVDWVRWEIRPWRDDTGAVGGVVHFSELLTDQHQTSLALQASEARHRALFEQAVIGIAQVDPDTHRFVEVNDAACRIVGYPRDVLLARRWSDFTHPGDVDDNRRQLRRLEAGEVRSITLEKRFVREGSDVIWARVTVTPVALPGGGRTYLVTQEDITEERRAALALRERERRLATVFRSALAAMVVSRVADHRIIEVSDSFTEMLGWSRAEALGRNGGDLDFWVEPADQQRVHAILDDPDPLARMQGEVRGRRKSGEVGVFHFSLGRIDVDGEPCVILALQDVTAERRADEARRETERHLHALFDLAPIGICEVDPVAGRVLVANEAMRRLLGQEVVGLSAEMVFDELVHPDDRAAARSDVARLRDGLVDEICADRRYLRPDGTVVCALVTARLLEQSGSRRVLATLQDVTAARRDDAALRMYKTAIDAAANAVVITDARAIVEMVNPAFTRLTGYAEEDIVGRSMRVLRSGAQAETFYKDLWGAVAAGRVWRGEVVNRRKDGTLYVEDMTVTPLLGEEGRPAHYVAIKQDVTERKRADAELRESEERYRTLVDSLEDVVFTVDCRGIITFVNRAIANFGRAASAVVGRDFREIVLVDDEPLAIELLAMRDQGSVKELRLLDGVGKVRPVRVHLRPLAPSEKDEGSIGVIVDMTARREVEEQLRAAQKMEAVGRLAGGVAHDFNNLLSVILSYAELVAAELDASPTMQADVEEIIGAAHRAEGLTRQLLAFSRRQILSPEPTDLRELVRGLAKMLTRLIGEDVELRLDVEVDVPRVKVDRGEMEQVVMNLLVNARDAMPNGGRVTIALRPVGLDASRAGMLEVPPGSYVELEVRDTGTGMCDEVKRRIFEPFFTTKEVGKGTGLGLSMVFGIVRQSGGTVEVDSEPGNGSVFRILLPEHAGEERAAIPRVSTRVRRRAHECILLVEDEAALRTVAERVLRREGYDVLCAGSASEALALAVQHGPRIELILTDVVMPLMGGPELAEHLRQRCPTAPVMFMSGYTDAVDRLGGLGGRFLRKPFDVAALVARVRDALDEASPVEARVAHSSEV